MAVTTPSGATETAGAYGDWGEPQLVGPALRFGYTGQMWLREARLHHYKARAYDPALGRFLQPDPIGFGDGPNLYAYVGGDPVNRIDPDGLARKNRYVKPVDGRRNDKGQAQVGFIPCGPDCAVVNGRPDPGISWGDLGDLMRHLERVFAGPVGGGGGGGGGKQGSPDCGTIYPDGSDARRNAASIRALLDQTHAELHSVGMDRSAASSGAFAQVFGIWLGSVVPHGRRDYKRKGGSDEMGNINFGATGTALGLPLELLLRAAGAVQGPNPENRGHWTDSSPDSSFGDQPRDQRAIRSGAQC